MKPNKSITSQFDASRLPFFADLRKWTCTYFTVGWWWLLLLLLLLWLFGVLVCKTA